MTKITGCFRFGRWGALVMLMLLIGAALHAQSVHGTLAGVVTDPTDAVIENAKVSAINMETAATYTGTTTPRCV